MIGVESKLKSLFKTWAKEEVINFVPLAQSGSYRKYFRISGQGKNAVGVYGPDKKENRAFQTFTKHFKKKRLNVPELYAQRLQENIYLIEDLGDTTLFSLVEKENQKSKNSESILKYYKDALLHLIRFQIDGGKGLDYSVCYPRQKFDLQSIQWDLNYFKYYFLKLIKIPFDEQKLEDDFKVFAKFLLSADKKYFMYRDFQSRNILIHNEELYFVDYQGGRKGALQYDVASLLFQAKVNLSPQIRSKLFDYYVDAISQTSNVKRQIFLKPYYNFVLIRLLQTLGAYGFRGYYENKAHFLQSIPYALKNLQWLIDSRHFPSGLPELRNAVNSILKNDVLRNLSPDIKNDKLKVTINSFSYKEGIPKDYSGNGGGFVFDCRSIENPGRYFEYKNSTGLDEDVINFLEKKESMKDFLNSVYSIVDKAVSNYIARDFENLLINFGCTGGQHRSVYCAENLAKHLKENFDINIQLNHTQLSHSGKNK
jgi:aminoglycoside/choline kinase family phosphotransferase